MIKKYIDAKAEFLFVPVEKIEGVVKKEKAIPYDAPNAELGHHGEKCSFDAIVEKYEINDLAVLELAKIVRAADTNKMETVPEAAGMKAIMEGTVTMAKDDHEAIERARPIYDALYTSCKLKFIRDKHKEEIEKMDRKQQKEFFNKKLAE